jgi:hypothetical protein
MQKRFYRRATGAGQFYRVKVTRADGQPAVNEGGYTLWSDANTRGEREVARLAAEGVVATYTVE